MIDQSAFSRYCDLFSIESHVMTLYDYLDRSCEDLTPPDRFLLASMRAWVKAARSGRCLCSALTYAFRYHGLEHALADFNAIMTALDSAAIGQLRFGSLDSERLTDDEARILALFGTARAVPVHRIRQLSANLVDEDAVAGLSEATGFVALAMADMKTGRRA